MLPIASLFYMYHYFVVQLCFILFALYISFEKNTKRFSFKKFFEKSTKRFYLFFFQIFEKIQKDFCILVLLWMSM